MGWFDEQIKQRKISDDEQFQDSFIRMAGAVMGAKAESALKDERARAKNAIDEILKYYHYKLQDVPDNIREWTDQLDYLMRPHGLMHRTVKLEKGWYKDACGPMLAVRRDTGMVTALIPGNIMGYTFLDEETGERRKVDSSTEQLFEEEGLCFYKPFPLRELTIKDMFSYILGTVTKSDVVLMIIVTLICTLVGMISPRLQQFLFSDVVDSKSVRILIAIAVFMICVRISENLLSIAKQMVNSRIESQMSMQVESAVMMRVLSLPASFFKQYSSGDLQTRTQYVSTLCNTLSMIIFSTGLTSVTSLLYIAQIRSFAPSMAVPALIIIVITVCFSMVTTLVQMRISKQQMELSAKENGLSYSLISGVQKIRLAGAEKRAFAKWADTFSKSASLTYNLPLFLRINGTITTALGLISTVIFYYLAIQSNITTADYYAFTASYGMVFGAFSSLSGIATTVAEIRPVLEMVEPFFKAVPETAEGKQVISRLSGGIEMSNVSFRYNDSMPLVIDSMNLKIRPGQYVAIVGRTGCGKSTLMRLLLGFETPSKGAVYYDGKDIARLDLKSLRQKIGTVMQNGKLFMGSIYENISISAPSLTMQGAWDAAEMAGLADDIREMPMGMMTIIGEGQGGISGGQKQRIMIARAVAGKPRILMFDEATSALDNHTQKKVTEALDALKCTRIVIAHRLSTIRHCDRILVLDQGRIIEDGTYEELIEKNGFFADLVSRQRLDT